MKFHFQIMNSIISFLCHLLKDLILNWHLFSRLKGQRKVRINRYVVVEITLFPFCYFKEETNLNILTLLNWYYTGYPGLIYFQLI